MKEKEEIGKLIASKRKELNITQQELAKKLNVTDKAISNWETGKNYPDYCYFNALKEILGIDFNYDSSSNRKRKLKNIKIAIVMLILVILSLLVIYTANNYNKYKIYELNIDDQEMMINESYLIQYQENIIITLNELENKKFLNQPTYNIQLYYIKNGEKNILSEIENYKGTIIKISENEITKIIDNLYIQIEYEHLGEKNSVDAKIDLILKESNTHLLKSKEPSKNNENQAINTLLVNNGYKKWNENIYVKKVEAEEYIYNIKTNIMKYQYLNGNKVITAEYQNIPNEQGILKYEIIKNNEIMEKYELNQSQENLSYYNELYTKIYKECAKIK